MELCQIIYDKSHFYQIELNFIVYLYVPVSGLSHYTDVSALTSILLNLTWYNSFMALESMSVK